MLRLSTFSNRLWLVLTGLVLVVVGVAWSQRLREAMSIAWESEAKITAYPLVDGDSFYLGTYDGFVYRLDIRRGRVGWSFRTNNFSPYPIVDGGEFVYVNDFDGRVYKLRKEDGGEEWRFVIPGLIQPDTQLVVSDGLILVGVRNGMLYAIDEKTGVRMWEVEVGTVDRSLLYPGRSFIHFGLLGVDEEKVYVNSVTGAYLALDIRTGREVWRYDSYGFVPRKPIVGESVVVVESGDGRVVGLDKKRGDEVWQLEVEDINESKVVETSDSFLVKLGKSVLVAMDKASGKEKFRVTTQEQILELTVEEERIFTIGFFGNKRGVLSVYEASTGQRLWQVESYGVMNGLPVVEEGLVYQATEAGELWALDIEDGNKEWIYEVVGSVQRPVVGDGKVVVIVQESGGKSSLRLLDISGEELYRIKTVDVEDNVDAYTWKMSLSDGELVPVKIVDDRVFFFESGLVSLYTLGRDQEFEEVAVDGRVTVGEERGGLLARLAKKTPGKGKLVAVGADRVGVGEVYEVTLSYDEDLLGIEGRKAKVEAVFENGDESLETEGFYYDRDVWKVRFTPETAGEWRWRVVLDTGQGKVRDRGEMTVTETDWSGFLRVGDEEPAQLVFGDGSSFDGIGIQDIIEDFDYNGNPIDQWGLDGEHAEGAPIPMVDFGTYLDVYGPDGAGFNLFRWGVDNASFKLWKDIEDGYVFFGVNEGIWGDEIVEKLKEHGYRTWMGIFGFTPPLYDIEDLSDGEKAALQEYVKYVVARYGAYVDVWELANETTVSDEWLEVVNKQLKESDIYHHPVTINWQRPGLEAIDINSVHWYLREDKRESDLVTVNEIGKARRWGKPVVFSEQGNQGANWDESSATRMRVRSWTAFFKQAMTIFWNESKGIHWNEKNANIYLGPEERGYVRVLHDFANEVSGKRSMEDFVTHTANVRGYGFRSDQGLWGYLVNGGNQKQEVMADVEVELSKSGEVEWVEPKSGTVVEKASLEAGRQVVESPGFLVDMAMRIKY